jgi:hypothetical protein
LYSFETLSEHYANIGQYSITPFRLLIPYEYLNLSGNKLVASKEPQSEYSGKDVRALDERKNRHPWQNSVLDFFYDEKTNEFLESDNRLIYWIQDKKGATGKSKFVKWVCVNQPDDVAKVVYGNGAHINK